MLALQQLHRSWLFSVPAMLLMAALTLVLVVPRGVSAQTPEHSSFVADVVKRVAFDPTTYAPAAIAYDATVRDWKTSQPFFEHGSTEMNARFTVSGLPNDRPISNADGSRRILQDALVNLQISLVSNAADQIIERALVDRFPNHRRLVRTVGWVQRISWASYLSYRFSSQHFRQAGLNEELARQNGF